MRLLETWVETPLAAALGWTLLHSLWEGAILAAALAAALVAARSPRVRYGAACAAMLAMLAAFALTLVRVLPEGGHGVRMAGPPSLPAWDIRAAADAGPFHLELAGAVPWLAPLWLAGVWIFCARQVAGWISAQRLRRRGVCCAPERWRNVLARWCGRLRVSRPVLLLESCLVEVPIVVGHFRPCILMPIGLLAGLPAGQVEAILLHELAHIRRYDYLVNALQRLVEGLLFHHPAVWWISRTIRAERENCCDDVVVAMSGNAREYAAALAAVEQSRCSGREPVLAATGGNLVKRIRRLLYPNGSSGAWTPLCAAVLLAATAALAVAAWQAAPQQASAAAQAPRTESSPYEKWLNQDVVYIIAAEERAAFGKLTTDEERDKFIEQFWQRRDPMPETAQNEFKAEHYRRIAYANQRFVTAAKPGWQTDRGRMYTVYGPPDEIESHPAHRPYAYEAWRYRHLEGIGDDLYVTFIDRTGTGNYEVAPGNVR